MESQSLNNQQEASKKSPKTTLSDDVVEIAGPSVRQKEREERGELQWVKQDPSPLQHEQNSWRELPNLQENHQVFVINMEGKVYNQIVSILFDPGSNIVISFLSLWKDSS